MKRVLVVVAVAALGFWGGVRAYHSPSLFAQFQTGLATVIGCNLLLCVWLWFRARPGSGDSMVLPTAVLLSASLLIGILPRLFWPSAEGLHLAGSIASVIVPAGLLVIQHRRRRRLRQSGQSV